MSTTGFEVRDRTILTVATVFAGIGLAIAAVFDVGARLRQDTEGLV